MSKARIRVLGVPVDPVNMQQAVARAQEWVEQGQQGNILAVNPEKVMRAREDKQVMHLLDDATLLIPDGIGVVKAAKWLGLGHFERVAGSDLMPQLCAMASNEGFSVFLFGAEEAVNQAACNALLKRFPTLKIAGRANGFVTPEQYPKLVTQINEAGVQLVFVALGSPRQELWMQEFMPQLSANVFQGVGGTFDVLAGKVARAPALFRRLHMEWLYRLLSNPRRLLRQTTLPRFMFNVLRQKLLRRSSDI